MTDFVNLHVHTEYSLLDGAAKIDKLIDRAVDLGQKSIAITDHGVMYGVIEFYKKAIERGIKPIIGCEVYVAPTERTVKERYGEYNYSHLVLLAKDNTGYRNLCKIVSDAYIKGFYYKPRTDMQMLSKYSEGIIALSACYAGDIQRYILENNIASAENKIYEYKEIFKDDFYLELQDHNLKDDKKIIDGLINLSKKTNTAIVATNDVHYVDKEDAYLQKILLCIGTNKFYSEDNPLGFETDEFYLKSGDEMFEIFSYIPQAVENSIKIANECNVTFDFSNLHVPKFKTPQRIDSYEYLYQKCLAGLLKRYNDKRYIDRLEYELSVIKKMQFVDYFLIVADFVDYAKRNDIAVGPGRGSATGSIVSYCLGITDIDPMKYGLIFERFLNPGRTSMPDIDIDFCVERRQEIITYLLARYGLDSVAQIITFGTLAARAAIRDVGRVLEIPYSTVESVVKHFPTKPGTTISSVLETDEDLKNRYRNNTEIRNLIDTAIAVEGFPRHGSTHAAGVVVTNGPVSDYLPLSKNDNVVVTQFQKNEVEELGLLKIDLLGLRNITVIDKTVKLIKEFEADFDIEKIPENDKKTFDMISLGNTFGVFQLESAGMRKLLTNLKPNCIDDIITAVSLYRPGPMDSIPQYISNRNSPDKIKYLTPKLENILKDTYGCIVYQEQVMQIARELAGYSFERADILRAAMSKKKYDVMKAENKIFVDGCKSNGISVKIAQSVFDDMSEFARYGFNKSHAAGYAVIAYRTAYLKANYPAVFMASLLSSVMYNTDKIKEYVAECTRLGIDVKAPNINKSRYEFFAEDNTVFYGLSAVKNVGKKMAVAIENQRQLEGAFEDFDDFISRMSYSDITKRAVESLIKCGTFDCFGYSRRHMLSVYDNIMNKFARIQRELDGNQMTFFDEEEIGYNDDFYSDPLPEYSMTKLLGLEKDSLGLYLSDNPLKRFMPAYDSGKYTLITNAREISDGEKVEILGIIDSVRLASTKQLKDMAYISVEDITGFADVIFFPRQFSEYKSFFDIGALVEISATVSRRGENTVQFICNTARFPNPETVEQLYRKLYINIPAEKSPLYRRAINMLKQSPGDNTCIFHFADTGKTVSTANKLKVYLSYTLIEDLKLLLGEENIVIK